MPGDTKQRTCVLTTGTLQRYHMHARNGRQNTAGDSGCRCKSPSSGALGPCNWSACQHSTRTTCSWCSEHGILSRLPKAGHSRCHKSADSAGGMLRIHLLCLYTNFVWHHCTMRVPLCRLQMLSMRCCRSTWPCWADCLLMSHVCICSDSSDKYNTTAGLQCS